MRFQRLRFPQDYDRLPSSAPGWLDELIPLDANARPAATAQVDRFAQGSRVQTWGWALIPAPEGCELPAAVVLSIGTTGVRFQTRTGIVRDDIWRDFGNAQLLRAGFRGVHSLDAVPLGRHKLSLLVVSQDFGYHEVPLAREIEVVASSEQFPSVPQSEQTKIVPAPLEAMHAPPGAASARFRVGDIVVARGEAFERETRFAAAQIFAIVDERTYIPGVAGIVSDRGERIAYSVRIPTSRLTRGSHSLRIAAIARDGTSFTLGPQTPFSLRRA